jgi:hypothetical protein
MRRLLHFCCLALPALSLIAQEPEPASFFPHHVGDTWTYRYYHGRIDKLIITKIEEQNLNTLLYYNQSDNVFYTVTDQQNVYYKDRLEYKLTAQKGETWTVHPADSDGHGRIDAAVNVYPSIIFGRPTTIMEIGYFKLLPGEDTITSNSLYEYTDWLAAGIGLIQEIGEGSNEPEFVLTGCVINGDTLGVLTDVRDGTTTNNNLLLSLFPNPSSSMTAVRFSFPPRITEAVVTLYDLFGHTVYEQKTSDTAIRLDVSSLPTGVYFCRVQAGMTTEFQKLFVQQ